MAKKSNNNKDIRHGDRTRQNKDEIGIKAEHRNERGGGRLGDAEWLAGRNKKNTP